MKSYLDRYRKKLPYIYKSVTNRFIVLLASVGIYKEQIVETITTHTDLLENDVSLGLSFSLIAFGAGATKGYIDKDYKEPLEERPDPWESDDDDCNKEKDEIELFIGDE